MGGVEKIKDGVTEQGDTTIDNLSVVVDTDAADDSMKIGAQANAASGQFYGEKASAVDPSWGTQLLWSFDSQGIALKNKGTETIEFSYDGVNKAGEVEAGVKEFYDHRHHQGIYVRSVSGSQTMGVTVW